MPVKIEYDKPQVDRIILHLQDIPKKAFPLVVEGIAHYIVGDEGSQMSHGLKHAPYYKYVNRQAGFAGSSYTTSTGKIVPGYSSAKQHRYVMAAIADGRIIPGQDNRTGRMENAWKVGGTPYRPTITNSTPYWGFMQGDSQTRMAKLIGWRRIQDIVASNIKGAVRHGLAILHQWMAANK
jgi:hypothetical protein